MFRRRFIAAVATGAAVIGGGSGFSVDRRQESAISHGRAVRRRGLQADPSAVTMLWRAPTNEPIVAMTFDDGPDPRFTPPILDILAKHESSATFFQQGQHVAEHPDLAKAVVDQGHIVGNHTYTHPHLDSAPAVQARDELERTHEVIERVTGQAPRTFRPPYGSLSGATSMVAADLGYDIVLWSDRISSRRRPNDNIKRVDESLRPGSIVLAHDGGGLPNEAVVACLDRLIGSLKAKGIQLVTIAELLS